MSLAPWDPDHPALWDDVAVRRALWAYLRRRWADLKHGGDTHRLCNAAYQHDTEPALEVARMATGTDRPDQEGLVAFWHGAAFARIAEAACSFVNDGILWAHPHRTPWFFFTAYGARCIEADDQGLVFDAAGFVEAFKRDFAGAPEAEVMARYLGQASTALQHHMDLAAATMLGCAYELSVLQLADAVVDRWGDDFQVGNLGTEHKKSLRAHRFARLAAQTPPAIGDKKVFVPTISDLIDAVEATLLAADKEAPNLMAEHSEWIESALGPTYLHVRRMRNKAGHPTGKAIARADIHGAVVLFTPTYRHVYGIIRALGRQR